MGGFFSFAPYFSKVFNNHAYITFMIRSLWYHCFFNKQLKENGPPRRLTLDSVSQTFRMNFLTPI